MAEPGSQEWIEASLAKLEELEGAREALANDEDGDLNEIARLDAEIAELYASLESVAQEEEEEEEEAAAAPAPAPAPEPEPEPEPEPIAPPAQTEPEIEDSPFGAPAPAAAAAAGFSGDNSWADNYIADEAPKGGAAKWIVLALILIGGGVGGYMWMQGQKDAEAAAAAAADADKPDTTPKVIQAVVVPEDTEDLKTAKGQDVDRLPGSEVEKKKARGGSGGGGSRGGSKTALPKKRGDGRSISLSDNDDPLG